MKVLVTGGAGFIGSHLVDLLVKDKHKVYVIDDLSGGYTRNVNEKASLHILDLREEKAADKMISVIKPEVVYHLAANAAENKSVFSPIDITSRNWNTFINTLVPAVRNGMKRIVVTSSVAVYGHGNPPFLETHTPAPEDLYGWSKYQMEGSLKVLAKVHGFEYVIARPHNVYGPRQNMADPYRNVVTIFMNSFLNGQKYFIYGDGEYRRCFSYVDDVALALYKCGTEKKVANMIFNIGSDADYTINELSRIVQKVSGIKAKPTYIKERHQEVKTATADHTLAKKYLGYKDSVSFEEGLKNTWKYVKSIGYQKPVFTKIEIGHDKLPENWK